MSKGNSLREEIRLERLKGLKNKPFSYKLKYYIDYYKYHVLSAAVIVLIAFLLVKSIVNQKETVLSVALINCNQEANYDEWIDNYASLVGIKDNQDMSIDYTYAFFDEAYAYQMKQKFYVTSAAGKVDVVIAPKSYFDEYAKVGYMADLSGLLSEDELNANAKLLYEMNFKDEETEYKEGDEVKSEKYRESEDKIKIGEHKEIVGVDISNAAQIKDGQWYDYLEEPLYLGICAAGENKEQGVELLKYLQK